MKEISFLSLSEVLEIHRDQVTRYGGSPGIRNIELLKSALGIPIATYGGEFLHTDLFEIAAAYLFHIVKNHPFVDGNKRTAVASALVFLISNGYDMTVLQDKLVKMVLSVTKGDIGKADITVFIRKWAVNLK